MSVVAKKKQKLILWFNFNWTLIPWIFYEEDIQIGVKNASESNLLDAIWHVCQCLSKTIFFYVNGKFCNVNPENTLVWKGWENLCNVILECSVQLWILMILPQFLCWYVATYFKISWIVSETGLHEPGIM